MADSVARDMYEWLRERDALTRPPDVSDRDWCWVIDHCQHGHSYRHIADLMASSPIDHGGPRPAFSFVRDRIQRALSKAGKAYRAREKEPDGRSPDDIQRSDRECDLQRG